MAVRVFRLLHHPLLVTNIIYTYSFGKECSIPIFYYHRVAFRSGTHGECLFNVFKVGLFISGFADFEIGSADDFSIFIALDGSGNKTAVLVNCEFFNMGVFANIPSFAQSVFSYHPMSIIIIRISIQNSCFHCGFTEFFTPVECYSSHRCSPQTGVVNRRLSSCCETVVVFRVVNRFLIACFANARIFVSLQSLTGHMSRETGNRTKYGTNVPHQTGSFTDGVKTCCAGDF